jgi:hypothetical protein
MKAAIELHLADHCIETTARHEYQRLVQRAIDDPQPDENIEAGLSLLTEFLGETDFRKLRAERPELSGGTGARVVLERAASGRVGWRIVAEP